jgi:type I restriction enzyme S subunit
MKYDCEYIPLPKLLSQIVDNRGKSVPTSDKGIKLIATNCIKNSSLFPIYEHLRYLSKETYNTWFRAHPLPGDIIFVNKGAPGSVCMVPDPVDFCIVQDMMAFRVDKMKVYNKYLFAYLRSRAVQQFIQNYHVGTMIPHFKKQDLEKILVPIPSMDIQIKIGDIYYMLCEKVELNNKLNNNLEQLVNNLFIRWFIDYKYDETTDSINESSIPEGWVDATLENTVQEVGTGADAIQRAPIVDYNTGIRCIRVGDMTNKRPYHEWGFCEITEENYKKYKLDVNDIVVTRTASNGLSYIILEEIQAVCNNGLIRLKVNKEYNPLFVYQLMQTQDFYDHIHKIDGETSTRPNMKIEYLLRYKFIKPLLSIQNDFVDLVKPVILKRNELINENKNLIELRDTLLPSLMSGEIDLDDFELEVL